MEEIVDKANYCLGCLSKPCSQKGCPIHTNIPEFISKIKENKLAEAYDILHEKNVFSHICSIVCPQENQCEGSCIRGIKQTPTSIGQLEKYVNDWAEENSYEYKIDKKELNGKKVAVIGAGPAGLAFSYDLLREGFSIDIYEKESFAGGILMYGIPDFRLSKDKVEKVINIIKTLGANFIFNKELGKDIDLKSLQEKYDYVFVGIGANVSTMYSLSDKYNNNVYKPDDFLRAYFDKKYIKDLGIVTVIGGGNVAMDVARVALRMGATKVKILYRRDEEHMPARKIELKKAIEEGVDFKELVRVDSANYDENGNMVSVNCIRTEINELGKAQDRNNGNDKFIEETNNVVFAIGLKPDKTLINSCNLNLDDYGYVKLDLENMSSIENVYSGGDISQSKSTVAYAIADGKKAALSIIESLDE